MLLGPPDASANFVPVVGQELLQDGSQKRTADAARQFHLPHFASARQQPAVVPSWSQAGQHPGASEEHEPGSQSAADRQRQPGNGQNGSHRAGPASSGGRFAWISGSQRGRRRGTGQQQQRGAQEQASRAGHLSGGSRPAGISADVHQGWQQDQTNGRQAADRAAWLGFHHGPQTVRPSQRLTVKRSATWAPPEVWVLAEGSAGSGPTSDAAHPQPEQQQQHKEGHDAAAGAGMERVAFQLQEDTAPVLAATAKAGSGVDPRWDAAARQAGEASTSAQVPSAQQPDGRLRPAHHSQEAGGYSRWGGRERLPTLRAERSCLRPGRAQVEPLQASQQQQLQGEPDMHGPGLSVCPTWDLKCCCSLLDMRDQLQRSQGCFPSAEAQVPEHQQSHAVADALAATLSHQLSHHEDVRQQQDISNQLDEPALQLHDSSTQSQNDSQPQPSLLQAPLSDPQEPTQKPAQLPFNLRWLSKPAPPAPAEGMPTTEADSVPFDTRHSDSITTGQIPLPIQRLPWRVRRSEGRLLLSLARQGAGRQFSGEAAVVSPVPAAFKVSRWQVPQAEVRRLWQPSATREQPAAVADQQAAGEPYHVDTEQLPAQLAASREETAVAEGSQKAAHGQQQATATLQEPGDKAGERPRRHAEQKPASGFSSESYKPGAAVQRPHRGEAAPCLHQTSGIIHSSCFVQWHVLLVDLLNRLSPHHC